MTLPLQFINVSKSFNDKKVLDEVNFSVSSKEIFGFIGLNGVGKTTLIKITLDLLDQSDGEVKIFGKSRILPESRQKVCYLPEKFSPPSELEGQEFIKFVLSFYHKKYDSFKTKELCDSLELDFDILKTRVTKYSKGMTQKLGLIATFLSESELIILDEPMSGLDPKARIALKEQLIKYQKQDKTIFFSSHILADMDEICNNIAVLNNKKIVYSGDVNGFKVKHNKNNLDQAFLAEIGVC